MEIIQQKNYIFHIGVGVFEIAFNARYANNIHLKKVLTFYFYLLDFNRFLKICMCEHDTSLVLKTLSLGK